ncbi:MAG: VOC family protein [Sphingosinicella sp.]|nr:VOC family protein [Sphingosinicella sp.]
MLDHIALRVSDIERSRTFYEAALAPLGMKVLREYSPSQTDSGGTSIGFGTGMKPFFWIGDGGPPTPGVHVALDAGSRDLVDACYQAAITAGGRDNGAPGLRPNYHPNYYGAFVLDPDGINLEAVCHGPA